MGGIPPLKTYVQGLNALLTYTGSYDEVYLGYRDLHEVLEILETIKSISYPPQTLSGELCPAGLFIERDGVNLCIYYNGEGLFSVRLIDNNVGEDTWLAENVDLNRVRQYVTNFYRKTESVQISGEGPSRYVIEVEDMRCDDWGEDCYTFRKKITISRKYIDWHRDDTVISITFKKGGFLRDPKMIIEYIDDKGKRRKEQYTFRNNEEGLKAYSLVASLHPGKTRLK